MLKRITIKDVAEELNISVCTINKALNGKPRISEETRQRVIEAANRMGYKPNRLAQALARRSIFIGIVYPSAWQTFFGSLVEGVRDGLGELRDHNVRADFREAHAELPCEGMVETARSLLRGGIDGLIVCPFYEQEYTEEWKQLVETDVPTVFLGVDVPGVRCLSTVRLDAFRCGRMASELLSAMVDSGKVAMIVGSMEHPDHRHKAEGFREEAARLGISIVGIYETRDDASRGYPVAERILQEHPNLRGLYIATDNSEGICRYLEQHSLAGKVKVVATGVFPEIKSMMDRGIVQSTLFQNMKKQGRLAVRVLYQYLSERIAPEQEILVPPVVILRNNIDEWQ